MYIRLVKAISRVTILAVILTGLLQQPQKVQAIPLLWGSPPRVTCA